MSNKTILYIMLVPCLILLIAFNYIPLFGWIYAFYDYFPGYKLFDTKFVGFKYFIMAFNDGEVFRVLRNTLVLSLLGIVVSPLPALFAIVLSEMKNKRFRMIIQTTTTFPNYISWIITFSIFTMLFAYDDGLVNKILSLFGGAPVNPLVNNDIVWVFQTLIGVWKTLGFSAIIYFAAITSIDHELYDAASVDGAGRFGKMWHITMPGISSTYITLLLLGIGNLLNTGFDQFYVFYNPLVYKNIEVLDLYLYRVGIEMGSFSLSTAIGVTKSIIGVSLLFLANAISKRVRGQSIF